MGKIHDYWRLKMIDKNKLGYYISRYTNDFDKAGVGGKVWWTEEKYKWQAVKAFHECFDLEAEDFPAMLDKALKPSNNLLELGAQRKSRSMIVSIAENEPETVRNLFRRLFDENTAVLSRITAFKETVNDLFIRQKSGGLWKENDHHYQDENAISTYLWLWKTEKYFIYKFSVLKTVATELTDASEAYKVVKGHIEDNWKIFQAIVTEISEELKANSDLINKATSLVNKDESCDKDKEKHILTYDFMFYIDQDIKGWLPEKYDPDISADQWQVLLKNPSVFNETSLKIIWYLKDYGGRATCSQLSDEYGESPDYYQNNFVALAKRVQKEVQCPLYKDPKNEETDSYWPILFLGKPASKKEKGSFIWRLREPLDEALEDSELPIDPVSTTKETPASSELKLCYNSYTNDRSDHNLIFFGAPGTGKSFRLNNEKIDLLGGDCPDQYERVTFHPDYTYASFVGTYKPVSRDGEITYEFVPGPFMRLYAAALKSAQTDSPKPYLLIIEEINRANAAAVFGDVFQLLDRDEDGVSDYPIQASEEIRKYLSQTLCRKPEDFAQLRFPNNMFIWATMNSADQGVFPLDTAFKRRWDFEYIDIDNREEKIKGKAFDLVGKKIEWNSLRKAINNYLARQNINEDKLMGAFFIEILKKQDSEETIGNERFKQLFKNKVLMYLFEDAARHLRPSLFAGCPNTYRYSEICREFDNIGIKIFNDEIVKEVPVIPAVEEPQQ